MSRLHDALRRTALETELLCPTKARSRSSSDPLLTGGESIEEDGRIPDHGDDAECEKRSVGPQLRDGRRPSIYLSEGAQEQVVNFVQRVFVFPNSTAPRLVIFSSIDESSASSEICFRSGAALSTQVSGSVCIVDANLRAPSLHQLSGIEKFPGLADAMINPDPIKNFAVQIARENLWLMPAGSWGLEAPSLFATDRLCSRMEELKEEFDYVLVDAPPASSCGDAVLLGQMSDGVVVIVEANSTRRETARITKESFESANVKLLGAILNNSTLPIPKALYRKV